MKTIRTMLTPLLALTLLAGGLSIHAQGALYSREQIDQMVAPIALYPDALMSQVLMAATFPDQVQDADQWVRANPGLSGKQLDDALATATWDPSVISLCKVPAVLDRMADNIKWTSDLGNAFLNQKADVLDSAQRLRRAAYDSGHLATTPQQRVEVQDRTIVIQPAAPEVVYVPAYDPYVVYGPAWYYPTYYYPSVWAPWPGYAFVNGFAWGVGFAIGNIFFGGCDWYHHDVWVNNAVIYNCGLYHNSPYYHNGDWRGGYGHQPWNHHDGHGDYARGGSGAPYGGLNHGAVRGVDRMTSGMPARGSQQADLRGARGAGRVDRAPATAPVDRGARGMDRPGARDASGNVSRGDARAAHGPSGWTNPSTGRPGSRSEPGAVVGNPRRDAGGPAAHGPTGQWAFGGPRSTTRGSEGWSGRTAGRPAAHGPDGWAGRGSGRPSAESPAVNPGRSFSRPDARAPAGSSRQDLGRPSSRGQAGWGGGSYSRPDRGAPTSYSREGSSRPTYRSPSYNPGRSYSAPSYRSQGGSFSRPPSGGGRAAGGSFSPGGSGGHGGGAGRAPAARGGGGHRR